MKYITLIIGLLVVGCGKQEQTDANKSTPTTNTNEVSGTTAKSVKELTPEEQKVVGAYEMVNTDKLFNKKSANNTYTFKLLDDKVYEVYTNGKKMGEGKWTIFNGEVHTLIAKKGGGDGEHIVYRVNPEGFGLKAGSLTGIAEYEFNTDNRTGFPEDNRHTFKKLD